MSFSDRFRPPTRNELHDSCTRFKPTRNALYEPYKIGSGWYFDSKFGKHGPYIAEEYCQQRAEEVRERDGD